MKYSTANDIACGIGIALVGMALIPDLGHFLMFVFGAILVITTITPESHD